MLMISKAFVKIAAHSNCAMIPKKSCRQPESGCVSAISSQSFPTQFTFDQRLVSVGRPRDVKQNGLLDLRALILGTPDYSIQAGKLDCRTSPEADRFHHELQQGQ
jgi:hypothetical protein